MKCVILTIVLVFLSGCQQLYSKDTIIVGGPEFCGPRWQILGMLSAFKSEKLISGSKVTLDQVQLELTSSEEEKTASVLVSWPEGFSCVIASARYVIIKTPGQEM